MEPGKLPQPLLLPSGRTVTPTEKQVNTVELVSEHIRNGTPIDKGELLREVGYEESTSLRPSQVFGSPTVIALMDKKGLKEEDLAEGHRYLLNAMRGEHMTFPPYNADAEGEEPEVESEEQEEMKNGLTRTKGKQMTDAMIRDYIASFGGIVHRIVHGEQTRHVYFRIRDTKALKEALDMAYNIRGAYAPKQLVGSHKHLIGVFSMKGLRQKMQKRGIQLVQPK